MPPKQPKEDQAIRLLPQYAGGSDGRGRLPARPPANVIFPSVRHILAGTSIGLDQFAPRRRQPDIAPDVPKR